MSLTDFSRNTRKHSRSLARTRQPKILTSKGKAALVVMSVATFEQMAQEAEEHRLDTRLREALKGYSKGDAGKPLGEAMTTLRQRASERRK